MGGHEKFIRGDLIVHLAARIQNMFARDSGGSNSRLRSRLAAAVLRGMCRQVEWGYPVEGDGAAPSAADTFSV